MSRRDDDFDAEFADLVASLDSEDLGKETLDGEVYADDVLAAHNPREKPAGADTASETDNRDASTKALKDPDDVPVDESLHLDGGKLSVGLVLAPIPSPGALHSLLTLSGLNLSVVRLKPWTAIWQRVETQPTDEEELDALLSGQRPMPTPIDEAARVVSRLSKYGAVAIMSWLVEGDGVEPGVSGRITAQRYVNGQPEETIPAGVLLGAMPQATEDLLLGRSTPEDYEDSVSADGTSRKRPGGFFGGLWKK